MEYYDALAQTNKGFSYIDNLLENWWAWAVVVIVFIYIVYKGGRK